jgi:ABC-type ATPase involved in cell division
VTKKTDDPNAPKLKSSGDWTHEEIMKTFGECHRLGVTCIVAISPNKIITYVLRTLD